MNLVSRALRTCQVTSLIAFSSVALIACDTSTTGPSSSSIEYQRSLWSAHNLTKYSYQYQETGFFNARAGRSFRVVVTADTVRSATDVVTGQAWSGAATDFPTLSALFDTVIAALQGKSLTSISYDPTYSYPSRLELSGPPDASGIINASDLQLLP